MGRYTLFNDYLLQHAPVHSVPDCMSIEVLKEIQNLGFDDDRLLVPALFYLGSERAKNARSENGLLTPGNVARMIEMTHLLKSLHGHKYNIYECSFLAFGVMEEGTVLERFLFSCAIAFSSALSLIAQILLLFILVYYNMSDITNFFKNSISYLSDFTSTSMWSEDWGAFVAVIITTSYFIKLVCAEWREASDFNAVFEKAEISSEVKNLLRKTLLDINLLVNGFLGAMIVFLNILFLAISEAHVNDVILNSLALLFILEMADGYHGFSPGKDLDTIIARNVLDYIKGDGGDVDVHVDMVLPTAASVEDCYLHLLESDDKVYLEVTDDNDQLLVTVHWRRRISGSLIRYDPVQFRITGANGRGFFDNIKEFRSTITLFDCFLQYYHD